MNTSLISFSLICWHPWIRDSDRRVSSHHTWHTWMFHTLTAVLDGIISKPNFPSGLSPSLRSPRSPSESCFMSSYISPNSIIRIPPANTHKKSTQVGFQCRTKSQASLSQSEVKEISSSFFQKSIFMHWVRYRAEICFINQSMESQSLLAPELTVQCLGSEKLQ